MKEIAVIGAGVVGLSTALSLQEATPSAKITLFADKFNKDTLSDGAPGLYIPGIHVDPDFKRAKKWCTDSLSHFLQIVRSPDAGNAGMELVSGYRLSSSASQIQHPFLQELLFDYRELNEKDLQMFPSIYKNGLFFTTVVIDCRYYLPWMASKFQKAGGKMVEKHLTNFNEIPESYDIIVNCTGLRAGQLLHDPMLVPMRGQTIKVKAPWIKHFYYGDEVYICPGVDYVTLGGVKDYGSWSTNVNPYQKQYIWDRCVELVPSLKKAEILWDWVGLRPHRSFVRVDASLVPSNGSHRLVVNNYGHGSSGITLSWGTAQEVVRIIQNLDTKKELLVSHL